MRRIPICHRWPAKEVKDGSGLEKRAENLRDVARIYREKGRRSYQRALEIDPNQIFALNNLGNGYLAEGERVLRADGIEAARPYLEKAKPYFKKAIEVEPEAWKHYANLATMCVWVKEFREAIPYVEWCVFAEKTSLIKKYGEGNAERIADAYRSATEEIAANPGARPSLNNPDIVVEPLTKKEKLDRATGIYSDIRSSLKEESTQSYLMSLKIAEAKSEEGDYPGAIKEIESTFGPLPKSPSAWIDLAAYYSLNGERDKARDLLSKRIIAKSPSDLEKVIDDITESPVKRKMLIDEMRKKAKEAGEREEAGESPAESPLDESGEPIKSSTDQIE